MDDRAARPSYLSPLQILAPSRQYKILLPLASLEEASLLLPVAEALMRHYGGQLTILHVVAVPEERSLSEAATRASESRQALANFIEDNTDLDTEIKSAVRVSREVWDGIWETVEHEDTDILLLGWESETLQKTATGRIEHPKLVDPPCNVVVVRPGKDLRQREDWNRCRRILLAVRGVGRRFHVPLRTANALALDLDARVTFLHVIDADTPDYERNTLPTIATAVRKHSQFSRSISVSGDVGRAILDESNGHDVVIMGAPMRDVTADGWGGRPLDVVSEQYEGTLIVVKRRRRVPTTEEHPGAEVSAREQRDQRPLEILVDKWFAENTFRSEEFSDIKRLMALKEKQGVTISLGLPALNEEETVGSVIKTVKDALMDEVPLLDEIVLIDSGSIDYTREIAADLNVPVHIHQEILPNHGAFRGKGEALWKSLYVLNGDIIAWIDTDIKNIHPRFVYGILGPLLLEPEIMYSKGFYRRPLKQGEKLVAGGGGRVTELAARPLLNLFFPELSGLIQPLSGEYAGRREVLEQLPFFTGYGVETGLLIDLLESSGLPSIGQVDLRQRIHHNQPLPSLSKMANVIIQVVIRRLEDRHKIRLLEDVNKSMNLIRYEKRSFFLEAEELNERERPPMLSIPEYREKFGRSEQAGEESINVEETA